MIDIDTAIAAELERMAPVTAEPDWDAVARAAGLASRRGRLRSRRQLAAVALAALVIAGGSVAAVKQVPWWQSGQPPVDPEAVASVARDNMPANVDAARARTVIEDGDAALVAAPLGASGYCLIPTLDGQGSLGAQCEYQVAHPEKGDDDRTVSLARPAGDGLSAAWLIYGRITDPRAAKLDLGPLTVQLSSGGFFLTQIPESRWATLDGTANSGRITDASGQTLRTGCVNWGPSPLNKQPGSADLPLFGDASGDCAPRQAPMMPPTIDLSRAEKLVEFTLVHDFSIWKTGTTIAIWSATAEDGSACTWVAPAAPAPSGTSHGLPGGPGGCAKSASQLRGDRKHAFFVGLSVGGGGLVTGNVTAASGIEKVVLRSGSGSTVLPLRNGWFVGQLPEGSHAGRLPPGGPFVLVGYSSDGTIAARQSIEQLVRQATPH